MLKWFVNFQACISIPICFTPEVARKAWFPRVMLFHLSLKTKLVLMKWGNLQHKGEITFVMPFLKREWVCLLTHGSSTNGGVKIVFLVGKIWISSFRSSYLLFLRTVRWELTDSIHFVFHSPVLRCDMGKGEKGLAAYLWSPGGSPGKWKAQLDRDPCFLHPCAQSSCSWQELDSGSSGGFVSIIPG